MLNLAGYWHVCCCYVVEELISLRSTFLADYVMLTLGVSEFQFIII